MAATVLTSVLAHGGRTSRYGEFTVVHMHACSFITTPMEYMQMQNWARARTSCGNPVRDRTAFVDRFETILGRVGSGVASRGSRGALARIVKAMKANSVMLEEWQVPRDLDQGVEIRKPVKPAASRLAPGAAPPAANELPPAANEAPSVAVVLPLAAVLPLAVVPPEVAAPFSVFPQPAK